MKRFAGFAAAVPLITGGLALLMATPVARAAVADLQVTGFEVRHEVKLTAPPDSAWQALVHPARWWDPGHTFSGDAKNLSIDARPGGLFLERTPDGGGITHLTVVRVVPGQLLRFTGAMGPMQGSGLAGSMTWQLTPDGPGTKLVLTYSIGGYLKGGFEKMGPACDAMLAGTVARYQSYVNTGKAVDPGQ